MKRSDQVTCVIPTIGRPELRRAVESVLKQRGGPPRVIVVLDRPEEREHVLSVVLADLTVDLMVTPGRVGGGRARNLGTLACSTPYVAYLDDDDWWEPLKLDRQLSLVHRDAQTVDDRVVSATAMSFIRPGQQPRSVPAVPYTEGTPIEDYLVTRSTLRYGRNAMQTSTLLVSRKLAIETLWRDDLPKHQDWDFIARLMRADSVSFVWVPAELTNVVQDSRDSVSKKPDWRTSSVWLESHWPNLGRRARSDFILTQVMRSALSARDKDGLRYALQSLRHSGLPHWPAVIVALSGILI
ncbi:glycosyltransferase family 2 protein [Gordonia sp. NPDC057258]|uniref:glycosyltransferase family 2 protein n=1 Tax=unclassified Gordonia (in: high G+C Gram-positive bacteria) TaxID=2657482 RepID=UPI00362D35FB